MSWLLVGDGPCVYVRASLSRDGGVRVVPTLHVESMAARGLLQVSPKGVRATPGALGKPGARRVVRRLVELQAAHTDVLLRLGVVELRTKRPARGR